MGGRSKILDWTQSIKTSKIIVSSILFNPPLQSSTITQKMLKGGYHRPSFIGNDFPNWTWLQAMGKSETYTAQMCQNTPGWLEDYLPFGFRPIFRGYVCETSNGEASSNDVIQVWVHLNHSTKKRIYIASLWWTLLKWPLINYKQTGWFNMFTLEK